MVIPSQVQIICKGCGQTGEPHRSHKLFCRVCGNRRNVEYQRQYRDRLKAIPLLLECKGCGKQFSTDGRGKKWRCQPCTTAYQAELRQKDMERHRGYSRNHRAKLGDAYRVKMVARRRDAVAAMTPDELEAFRRWEAEKSKRIAAELRKQVFAAYGGHRCACCGETEPMFLSIDHIDNDGAELRRNGTHGRGGTAFYQWLRKNGFPSGFQVLCMNCNQGKHRNGGVCPHQSGKV